MTTRYLKKPLALALVSCWLQIQLAWADEQHQQAKQWLEQMISASQTLSYEGTFVYIQGQTVEVMRIAQSSVTKRQRMFSLNGAPREVIVKDEAIMCVLPEQQVSFNTQHNRSPFPISLPNKLERLEDSYRFILLGNDRVADRTTQIVAIQPRDTLRYGYQLWLDKENATVLRSALVDENNKTLEQLVFTEINFKPEIDGSLLRSHYSSQLNPRSLADRAESILQPSAWSVTDLPKGFEKILQQRYPSRNSQNKNNSANTQIIEHFVFSDGLATVSVFVELLDDTRDALLEGASHMDATNAFGKLSEDHQILAVGEVPLQTVKQIANAIHYNQALVAK